MTRKERAIKMLHSGKIEQDTFGQLATHDFSDEVITKAIEREWITEEIAKQLITPTAEYEAPAVYKTFTDGIYQGYLTMKEIRKLRDEAQQLALEKQKTVNADHMVYGHYDLDEDGEILTAWLYSGLAYTDAEFERVQRLTRCHVFAYHKRS